MINIKSYGSMLLLSVVLLAACSKKQIKPKNADVNSQEDRSFQADRCESVYNIVKNVQDLLDIKKDLSACYWQTATMYSTLIFILLQTAKMAF